MTMSPAQEKIAKDVAENDVMLFMKGTPVFPQCGFSAAVVQILSELGVKFKSADVLKDPEIRQGIKEFSNWPTIPQLYVNGKFARRYYNEYLICSLCVNQVMYYWN